MSSCLCVSLTTPALSNRTKISEFPTNPKSLILEKCKTIRDLNQIHAHVIKTSLLLSNPSGVAENLLESAAILLPGSMDYALAIFRDIEKPDTPLYNILIRGFTMKKSPEQAVMWFKQMREESVAPDKYSLSCVLKACSRLGALREGEQVHSLAVRLGFGSNGHVQNTLIHMYGNCGEAGVARRVFDEMSEREVRTWNSMFAGFSKNGDWGEIAKLFREMLGAGEGFDGVTLISVLTACGRLRDLELGKWIHEYVMEKGLSKNLNLITALIDMFAKCGEVDTARKLFDDILERDVVAWSAMISGYNQSGRCREALDCAFETGKWLHSFIKRKKMKLTVTLGTALMDFYAKCGSVENSLKVFEKMPVKNVMSWTVLIQGLASNGEGRKALELFSLMLKKKTEPNDVTFIAVLSACSHTAGFIEEAHQFIKNMPVEPNAVIWRTLLASCRVHKNVEIGEESLKQLWEDAVRVRNFMKEKGIKKPPGCTLIEVDGAIHEFFAEDTAHPQSTEIYDAMEDMMKRIKSAGYVPNTAEARLDAEEGDKEASVSHHSEKLAIAFGLIRTSPGTTIRISKNLRVCTDCHTATKMISKVFERDIVVRDRNRFHHFKDGSCSCNDYW
ncbi:hypothetical protein Syun_020413 [Stephania yunnanensis]|uniref:DYW domain-containing protein n=1 Tax=Stephania yunnanensis TaxID=152371 RepID=A0AAP0IDV2_9MAGN